MEGERIKALGNKIKLEVNGNKAEMDSVHTPALVKMGACDIPGLHRCYSWGFPPDPQPRYARSAVRSKYYVHTW